MGWNQPRQGAEETASLPPLRGYFGVCPTFPWLAPWANFLRPSGANYEEIVVSLRFSFSAGVQRRSMQQPPFHH
jgi:hypothetical protein